MRNAESCISGRQSTGSELLKQARQRQLQFFGRTADFMTSGYPKHSPSAHPHSATKQCDAALRYFLSPVPHAACYTCSAYVSAYVGIRRHTYALTCGRILHSAACSVLYVLKDCLQGQRDKIITGLVLSLLAFTSTNVHILTQKAPAGAQRSMLKAAYTSSA